VPLSETQTPREAVLLFASCRDIECLNRTSIARTVAQVQGISAGSKKRLAGLSFDPKYLSPICDYIFLIQIK
jgi:hypothetical protein